MKTRVNLTIDETLLNKIKRYALKKKVSVSELVESHFKNLTRSARHETIIDIVDRLPKPAIPEDSDLKEGYYEDHAKKYGF